ncbi:MAG: hypothetical protein KKH45_11105 [Proteobacteria bacterium]|nr:hypothetical protein [Pseudomonadota bacterium]
MIVDQKSAGFHLLRYLSNFVDLLNFYIVEVNKRPANIDGFVKSPFSALLCILRRCGVAISTPLSSGFARLETEAFYFAV